ncbi:LacI family transcriptional regulator [Gluconobacter cerinus NRIC 0229]|uniref:LacI family DNA-binding transcriptional regulator n=1 Tax=Gluconobacter cerinus TaxID=38307 RepID=UPI002156DAC1|nr:LacI family DNA-binding transcriptional regulator [Gluconobacter cerinus]GBQ97076.1 LacI family transcriptional regulator [Gluconobacter cerinus NRIC 0229]
MSKGPTISDVATLAGLSKGAVSRYLNNKLVLPAETAARLEAAIQTLGFRRNHFAQRLSQGKSETIGLVVPEISDKFFAELAEGAELEAASANYGLILGIGRNDVSREIDFLRWLDTHMVDGLLFVSNRPDDGQLRDHLNRYRNIVILDEDIPGSHASKVFCDNVQGALYGVRHLISTGHRRIAHVSGPSALMSAGERLAGYRQALEDANLLFDPTLLLNGRYSRDYGRQAAIALSAMHPRPDAVFAGSDYIAIGLIEGFLDLGLTVPGDLSILGFDDIAPADMVTPRLTTIRQNAQTMGREGVRQLLATMSHPARPAMEIRTPIALVRRGSVRHRGRNPPI